MAIARDWARDIQIMHEKFGADRTVVAGFDAEKLLAFYRFRVDFCKEEVRELEEASEPEEVVDALIDTIVVCIGFLDAFGVDCQEAWERVLRANMAKEAGVNPGRPNQFGLPDLTKPPGWKAPDHRDNVGLLARVFEACRSEE